MHCSKKPLTFRTFPVLILRLLQKIQSQTAVQGQSFCLFGLSVSRALNRRRMTSKLAYVINVNLKLGPLFRYYSIQKAAVTELLFKH